MVKKKSKRADENLIVYAGPVGVREKRHAALSAEAARERRSVAETVWLALENGPSKELRAALKQAAAPKGD